MLAAWQAGERRRNRTAGTQIGGRRRNGLSTLRSWDAPRRQEIETIARIGLPLEGSL